MIAVHVTIAAMMIGWAAAVVALAVALILADHDAADVWDDQ